MTFTAALSQHPASAEATAEVVGQTLDRRSDPPDLAVLFATPHHRDLFEDVAGTVASLLSPGRLLGVTASGVVGGGREVEEGPALSLWTGTVDPVPAPVRLGALRTEAGTAVQGLPPAESTADHTLLLLADPFTMPVPELLDVLAARAPALPVIGGIASAATMPGGNRLVLDDQVLTDGAVGALLPSALVRPLVSQGCRPVGTPMIVTGAEGNLIGELAGQPALERLQQVAAQLDPDDRALLADGVHVGFVVDEHKSEFERGDFLVRNVAGADRASGSLTVGATVEVGTTVQFHVRDAATADEDLRAMLSPHGDAGGALLFTCNGRGRSLFDRPDHDAELVAAATRDQAVAGMFCGGEVGPVGTRSFLHGFTASVVLFGGSVGQVDTGHSP